MLVETYECEETAEETVEMAAEAVKIIEEMNLEGQHSLIAPKDDGEDAERIPYREMTAEEKWVFELVCPHQEKLRTYGRAPMPVRVLQVAAHAESLGIFTELFVWAAEPQQDPDPVLVARIGDGYSGTRWFLLARWGEALDEWPALWNKAVAKFRQIVADKFTAIRADMERDAAEAETLSDAELRRKGQPNYYR
jgi:hypothetical protein